MIFRVTLKALALTIATHLLTILLVLRPAQAGQQVTSRQLFGVHPDRRSHYELSGEQNFKCLDGSRTIPGQFVNDDYCDCLDASDEPGTSACPHGQFFCHNEGYIQKLIPSAWVNDGLCDCCDGSDERHNANASCENTCGVLGEIYRQEQERHREIADRGSSLRTQYKEQARQMREEKSLLLEQYRRELSEKESAIKALETDLNSDLGPSQVYSPLKGKCFDFKDREYTYKLCLFERATQESTSGIQTELGRWSGWAGPADNPYSRQRYDGGMQCWNGPTRSAVINIACGVEDKIVAVSEPSKCEYVYDFISPAACPDLDPPEPTAEATPTADQQEEEELNQHEGEVQEVGTGEAQAAGSVEEHPGLERDETDEEGQGSHDEL